MPENASANGGGATEKRRDKLDEAERVFRAAKEEAERKFFAGLERARTELPGDLQGELDHAERNLRDASDSAERNFNADLQRMRALEAERAAKQTREGDGRPSQ